MIVCICRGASERDIQAAIDRGASSVDSLQRCGIGGDCRGCERTLIEMISGVDRSEGCSASCAQELQFAPA